jgi:hypothetical protein
MFKNNFFFTFVKVATKKVPIRPKMFSPSCFVVVGSGIQDPGSGMDKIRTLP